MFATAAAIIFALWRTYYKLSAKSVKNLFSGYDRTNSKHLKLHQIVHLFDMKTKRN